VLAVDFHGDNFAWGGKFPGVNFPGEVLHWGDLTEFLYEILFICIIFSFYQLNFTCGNVPR